MGSLLVIGVEVFILSTRLHLGLTFALHRHTNFHKFQPSSHKKNKQKVPPKPIILVEDQHVDRVQNEQIFKWRNQRLLLPEHQLMETREEASAPTYAHPNRKMHQVYENLTCQQAWKIIIMQKAEGEK